MSLPQTNKPKIHDWISVYWPLDFRYYHAQVVAPNQIQYLTDNVIETIDWAREKYKILPRRPQYVSSGMVVVVPSTKRARTDHQQQDSNPARQDRTARHTHRQRNMVTQREATLRRWCHMHPSSPTTSHCYTNQN